MKTKQALLIAGLLLTWTGGCASTSSEPKPAASEKPYKDKPEPKLGMTKEEVMKIWGKPKRVNSTPAGENWEYDDMELAMIPFNFGFKPHFSHFIFNTEGKLVDYSIAKHD